MNSFFSDLFVKVAPGHSFAINKEITYYIYLSVEVFCTAVLIGDSINR